MVSIATAQNTAPVVTINSPTAAMVSAGTSVTFSGTATDDEQGDLSAGLVWTSSLQGAIGNGTSFTRADLVEGTHTIIASVTDNGGLGGSDSVVLTIEASEPPQQITLSATTRKVKGSKFVDLSWSGASGGSVDIKRNGAVIAPGIGGSTYTDTSLPKKSSTYTYQVCNAGTATCSNTVAVTF